MSLIKNCEQDLEKLLAWIDKEFTNEEKKLAPYIVTILEKVKIGIADGTLRSEASVLGIALNSPYPLEVEGLIERWVPQLFATWALKLGIPADPSPEDLKTVWNEVTTIWGIPQTRTDKIISGVATDLYGIVKNVLNFKTQTFAEDLIDIETGFKKIESDFNPA